LRSSNGIGLQANVRTASGGSKQIIEEIEIMSRSEHRIFNRRRFLSSTTALGAASILGWPDISQAEPPPETRKIRLVRIPAICIAPEYLAEELLRLEGFTEVEYVEMDRSGAEEMLFANRADISSTAPPNVLPALDAGKSVVTLAGIHGGCYELFAHPDVNAVRDLKDKRVAISVFGSIEYYFIASMVAYVGMNPRKDINWVEAKTFDRAMQYFIDGKVDAFLGSPPQPQILRRRKIGKVIVNTVEDKPWAQYFCCIVAAHPEFVANNPIATKRALRAILKATDICAREPERAAKYIVAKGYERNYDIALEVVQSLSFDRWRTYSLEDSLRFYALRLHEVGMIKTSPNALVAHGTDLRFLNELKKELKV
jgi:NitT/TauT family transport system substrate-binding protein